MAGHDMEALAQGIRESMDERVVDAYVSQARYLGALLGEADVPGLRSTYEPEHLRFFQARFAPLQAFPDIAVEHPGAVPALLRA